MENNNLINNLINHLPKDFTSRMESMLGDQYEAFINSFNEDAVKAFHVNKKRFAINDFNKLDIDLNKNPLSYYENGYYDLTNNKIGHNPLSHAGVIYSQDPAAMMPVAALSSLITGNEKILDLCSAPGGKASQLAMLLDDENGFLVSNEINASRNKILCSNIERMGYKNVLVTKLDPVDLALAYDSYFDIVVVDAPCSGEGMFRKYPESVNEWSIQNVLLCQNRQKDILDSAIKCLNSGGYLLYSTCTYSYEEDEAIVKWLIAEHDFKLVTPPSEVINITHETEYPEARKFFPHIAKGEGQFFCILQKGNSANQGATISNLGNITKINKSDLKIISSEIDSFINIDYDKLYKFNEKIIYISNPNVKVCTKGVTSAFVTIGTIEKNKFIINHQLFHCLGDLFTNTINFNLTDSEVSKYLHGEEIVINTNDTVSKGYGVFKVCGVPIGGFKASINNSVGRLKNHYPKGLRNNN